MCRAGSCSTERPLEDTERLRHPTSWYYVRVHLYFNRPPVFFFCSCESPSRFNLIFARVPVATRDVAFLMRAVFTLLNLAPLGSGKCRRMSNASRGNYGNDVNALRRGEFSGTDGFFYCGKLPVTFVNRRSNLGNGTEPR